MASHVVQGAQLQCSFGTAPSILGVTPQNRQVCSSVNSANIGDNIPMVNIQPFALCISLANPQVAAATSAALGVLTPQPCLPNTPAPWTTGSPTVILGQLPILNNESTLACLWGGVISVMMPGQIAKNVP